MQGANEEWKENGWDHSRSTASKEMPSQQPLHMSHSLEESRSSMS